MNEPEQDWYENELRRMTPAAPPADFMARLQAAKPVVAPKQKTISLPSPATRTAWWMMLRWVAPAMAVIVVGLLLTRSKLSPPTGSGERPLAVEVGFKADKVNVDQELVSSYDVVATLPGGEPVRFRCQQWNDRLKVTDKSRGVEIEENSPRVEVVPVRFETY